MSKRRLSTNQIKELLTNKNVENCSDRSITYNKEFKVWAVNKYYEEGYSPRMLFEEAGFDISIVGEDTPGFSLQRWRKEYQTRGIDSLKSERRGQGNRGGRSKTKGLTDADRIKRLEIENAYLKAENDFLAKLRAAKKR
jgi:transposase-like protein